MKRKIDRSPDPGYRNRYAQGAAERNRRRAETPEAEERRRVWKELWDASVLAAQEEHATRYPDPEVMKAQGLEAYGEMCLDLMETTDRHREAAHAEFHRRFPEILR